MALRGVWGVSCDEWGEIRRKLGNLFAQPQQGQVLAFGLEHDVEGTEAGRLGHAQQVDDGEGVEKVAVLVGEGRLPLLFAVTLDDARACARAAEVDLGDAVGRPGLLTRRPARRPRGGRWG